MSDQQPDPARRRFLQQSGASALAVTALAAGMGAQSSPAEAQSVNDAAILNFALNLEYLEAEFYMRAATGNGLLAADTSGNGFASSVVGGRQVPFTSDAVAQYAAEIAQDELNHVRLLRSGLGSSLVGEPAIDLNQSFATLGNLIGMPGFDPFSSDLNFLIGAYIFEDVGVTAYHGGSGLISNKQILSIAAGILAVEAYHAAEVRLQLFQAGAGTTTNSISNVRKMLSGANDDAGVVNADGTANIVLAGSNGIAFTRSPRQVLNIVYGAANVSRGLFFPNGLNGAVK